MRPRVGVAACLLLVLAFACVAALAIAKESGEMPFGRYEGSAAGSGANGKAFPITLYVNEGKNGQFDITLVTDKLPIPVGVKATPTAVPGGYDVPVSAEVGAIDLFGSGTLRLRSKDGQWQAFGSGSGNYGEKNGSGLASGTRVKGSSSAGTQVLDAVDGFFTFGGGKPPEVPSPAEYVDAEWTTSAEGATDVGTRTAEQESPAIGGSADEPPLTGTELAETIILLFILGLLGMLL